MAHYKKSSNQTSQDADHSQKGDHQWHAQIRKRGYPSQTRTFTTRADAERWATIVESEMERGMFVSRTEAEATLVSDAVERYRREVLPSKRGKAADESRLKTLLRYFGSYKLAALTSTLIAQFRDERLTAVGPQSVIHEINLLNRVLKAAVMDWGIALPHGLPTTNVRKPAKPKGRERRVSQEEIAAIVAHSSSSELSVAITVAVETGMRRGELAALTWSNVDLIKRTAHIPLTKTDAPRTVPLSSTAVAALQRLLPPHTEVIGKDRRVFAMQAASMQQALERACQAHRADIHNLRFHDLRHEATSRFFEKGLSMMEVAAITGHKTLEMLKRYTHLRAEDLAKRLG
ncbi:tyrosine-type recombinase/integrase [Acidovorax citrulli]|nr:tyrosine-type recombinase/integrase [Paracidovorax citrulli]